MSDIPEEKTEKPFDQVGHAEPPEKEFFAIPPQAVQSVWPLIKDDMAKIDNPDETPIEEVYYMLKTNMATLFMLHMKGERIGFVVLRVILPDLHIWLTHAKNGYDALKVFRPELMQVARNAGAKDVTFGSRRKAWQQVSGEHGFKTRSITYFCPVDPPGTNG